MLRPPALALDGDLLDELVVVGAQVLQLLRQTDLQGRHSMQYFRIIMKMIMLSYMVEIQVMHPGWAD